MARSPSLNSNVGPGILPFMVIPLVVTPPRVISLCSRVRLYSLTGRPSSFLSSPFVPTWAKEAEEKDRIANIITYFIFIYFLWLHTTVSAMSSCVV